MRILNKRIAGPIAALAILAGCVTATPYQPLGTSGARDGYSNVQLDQTHWRVNFVGNTLTSRERVENYLLYRAAELTLQQGFNCFTMVNRDVERNVTLRRTPGVGYSPYSPYWSPYWRTYGPWGWHHYDPWLGGPFFPGSYDVRAVDSYEATADIALSRGPCATTPATFDAAQVAQNLRPYIQTPAPRY